MKFNFEKISNTAKKIVVGTTIASTLSTPVEAGVRIKNHNDKTKGSIEKTNTFPEQNNNLNEEIYRNEYLKYMKHPSYKLRLAKEMFGDVIIDEEKQKSVDDEYNRRMSQIKRISIITIPNSLNHDPSNYLKINLGDTIIESILTTPYAAPHELSHVTNGYMDDSTKYKGFEIKKTKYISPKMIEGEDTLELKKYNANHSKFINILRDYLITNKKNIKLSPPDDLSWKKDALFDFVYSLLNEFNGPNFKIQDFWHYFYFKDCNIIYKKYPNLIDELESFEKNQTIRQDNIRIDNYFRKSTEIKARLNHLKLEAIRKFGYDLNDEFDINKYQELRNDKQYNELKDNLNLTDEQINELMKYTAMNTGTEDYYHPGWDYGNQENQV